MSSEDTNPVNPATGTALTATDETSAGTTTNPAAAINESTKPSVLPCALNTSTWPSDLKLDKNLDNWVEWDKQMSISLGLSNGLRQYAMGTVRKPDASVEPKAAQNWTNNDTVVLSFIFSKVVDSEYKLISHCNTSREAMQILRDRHQLQGPLKQVLLIHEALNIRYTKTVKYSETTTKLQELNERIWAMGTPNSDAFLTILMLNALSGELNEIRSQVTMQLSQGVCTPDLIWKRLDTETSLQAAEAGPPVVLVAQGTQAKSATLQTERCSNCRKTNHSAQFCVRPGGGMAGKSITEARDAQKVARGQKPRGSNSSTTQQTNDPNPPSIFWTGPDGHAYVVVNGKLTLAQQNPPQLPLPPSPSHTMTPPSPRSTITSTTLSSEFAGLATDRLHSLQSHLMSPGDTYEHRVWMAVEEKPYHAIHENTTAQQPFWLDTGATSSISSVRSDFVTVSPISPYAIRGVGGSAVHAVGVGTVRLPFEGGADVLIRNVLYVPEAMVRLISVSAITTQTGHTVSFNKERCWIEDSKGNTVCTGTLSPTRRLYMLDRLSPHMNHQAFIIRPRPSTLETWHKRLGHANYRTVYDMAKSGTVEGMIIDLSLEPPKCEPCILGKQTRNSVPKTREGPKAVRRLERVFVDLMGPAPTTSRCGNRYSMNLIDDFSSYPWSIALSKKSDAVTKLQQWEKLMEVQYGLRVGIYVTDNGELKSNEMREWCADRGIDHQFTAPYTSAQNGRAERLHLTIMNKARSMRIACGAPENFWDEFNHTAAYLSSFTPSVSLNGKTPYEIWHGKRPDVSHLREIGCKAFVLHEVNNPKIKPRSYECTLIGYEPHSKAYRCWHKPTGKVVASYNVTFVEQKGSTPRPLHPNHPAPNATKETPKGATEAATTYEAAMRESLDEGMDDEETKVDPPTTSSVEQPPHNEEPHNPPLRRSTRQPAIWTRQTSNDGRTHTPAVTRAIQESREAAGRVRAQRLEQRAQRLADVPTADPETTTTMHQEQGSVTEDDEAEVEDALQLGEALAAETINVESPDDPKNWREAMESVDRDEWVAGAREELQALRDMSVFTLVPRAMVPKDRKVLKGRFVCHRKRDENGTVIRHKVRFVCKGFEQIYGQDYTKTTAPTARLESFRAVLHFAAAAGWDIQQFDVKTAFLYGHLPAEEVQYMEQPAGFEEQGKEDWVWELQRGLYGMKQSGRIWNKTLHAKMTGWGFKRLDSEWCVYYRKTPTGTIIVAVHVDDMISAASSKAENDRFHAQLETEWKITRANAHFALGIAIKRDQEARTISLSQTALIDRIINQFGQKDAYPVSIPMDPSVKLRKPLASIILTNEQTNYLARIPYQSLVGSLMYLAIGTRPDIAYAVNRLAGYLNCYRLEHWHAACRVVRYLKGTRDLQLVLGGRMPLSLMGFTDADYANCIDTRRSVSGYCFSLGSGTISWASRRQRTVADSTCYAEYIATHTATRECMWLRYLLAGMGHKVNGPTSLLTDNNASLKLAEDQQFHSEAKHIDIKYHAVREQVEKGTIALSYVPSRDNTADIFTKALGPNLFLRLRSRLGLQ